MNYILLAVVTSSSNSFFITTVKSDSFVLTLTTIVGRIQNQTEILFSQIIIGYKYKYFVSPLVNTF